MRAGDPFGQRCDRARIPHLEHHGGYIDAPAGCELFMTTYREALSVAMATGAKLERTMIDPIPPQSDVDQWLDRVLAAYGDVKASMLQDFDRRRETEIDFINGDVVDVSGNYGVDTPANTAIVATVRSITRGDLQPNLALLSFVRGQPRK